MQKGRFLLLPERLLISVTLIAVLFLIMFPVVMLFYGSFRTTAPGQSGDFTLENYAMVFTSPWYLPTVLNTVIVAILSTALACCFGIPLGWIVSRTNVVGRQALDYLILTPIFISPLLGAVAWTTLASAKIGILNNIVMQLFGFPKPLFDIYSMWGVIWVMALYFVPFIYLFVSSALQSMDSTLEDASRICGASGFTTAVRITLPMVSPAILGGLLLVFVLAISTFTVPTVLGSPVGFYVLTSRTFIMLSEAPVDWGLATAMSVTLLVMAFSMLFVYRTLTLRKTFTTITGKAVRATLTSLSPAKTVLALSFGALYLLLAIVLPFGFIALNSFARFTNDFSSITLANFEWLSEHPYFWVALRNSLFVATVGASITAAMSFVVSWVVLRTKTRLGKLVDYVSTVPLALPGIVLAVGLLWAWISVPIGVYGTIWIIIIGSTAVTIPFGIRAATSALAQVHGELEEGAYVCGATWLQVTRKILIPLIKPGIAAAWVLLFIQFFQELSAVILLWFPDTITVPVLFFEFWGGQGSQVTRLCALGLVQTIVVFAMIFLFRKLGKAELKGISVD
ncbi:MAG: iron ABC transporter permease [Candidatus Bathyarchaeia archaeon]